MANQERFGLYIYLHDAVAQCDNDSNSMPSVYRNFEGGYIVKYRVSDLANTSTFVLVD